MKTDSRNDLNKLLHKAKNPLNSITLHAELGKLLIDNEASADELKRAFDVIIAQCQSCEKVLSEMQSTSKRE